MSTAKRVCSQAHYEDLFLRLLDSAFILDPDTGNILDVNDSAERLLETSSEEILGKPLKHWLAETDFDEFEKSLRVAKRRYHPREWDSCWKIHGTKPLIIRMSACSLKLLDGKDVIQVLARDVTREREAEKELHALNAKLEKISTTDEMTGLNNFRNFKNQLELEHSRSTRYKREYSLIFFDADNFKHYNDRNGHPAGDALLKGLASVIRANCRTTDLPARYGGEEFVVLCPEVGAQGATVFAERIRKAIEATVFPFGEFQPQGKVTVSVGVASYPKDGATPDQVKECSDQALYFSKKNGRNRVTTFESIKEKKSA